MSRKHFPQFHPSLETLDGRAMPSPALMQACAAGVYIKEIDTSSPALTASDTQVADGDGNIWGCYYTDKECVCNPL
jgi:hypothetical protein